MKRRTTVKLLLSGALGSAFLGASGWGQAKAMALGNSDNWSRALASYVALQKYFYKQDGSHLYLEQYPVQSGDNTYSYEWPFSQAHIATLDLSNIPGITGRQFARDLADRAQGQEHYWNTTGATGVAGYDSYPRPPYGNGGDKFYDDNEWVGLEKIQLYLMTGDRASLDRAKQIFQLVISGWDTDASHPAPGGVFWTQASWSHDRNTVSNMPGAEIGLRLYQITHDSSYLDWARKMYDWTNTNLLAPNGLYWDHIDLSGNIEKTQWSYNQGVPVGVNTLFYQITGDRSYLQKAENIASAALAFYGSDNLYKQPAPFNAIFFKNLLLLHSVNHNQSYVQAMQTYADTVWSKYRDAATGLFRFDSTKPTTQMIDQAAMTQIYAVLCWPPSRYGVLY
ncbi:glycoside hydrolase family 76 protein [Ktedonosporobacter rubrisoli]|uniref:glycoside hydrolase family 76 protein n=1 Tax=Ktedonosporobacter rubrisoli TaxID=2509675 RepID=UPI001F5DF384|nr:glycoside hydrolase family 76 protein [Ktedonosporobacter rubrisoli]